MNNRTCHAEGTAAIRRQPFGMLLSLPSDVTGMVLAELSIEHLQQTGRTCRVLRDQAAPRMKKAFRLHAMPFCLSAADILSGTQATLAAKSIQTEDAKVFADCCESGALSACQTVRWSRNDVSDEGLVALASALSNGALPKCTYLSAFRCDIGDMGTVALAHALKLGALANLSVLCLNSNRLGDAGIVALTDAARAGALLHLSKLCLSANHIGDIGITSLAAAAAAGQLAAVQCLVLERNWIGDAGMGALATAIVHGAFPACTKRRPSRPASYSPSALFATSDEQDARSTLRPIFLTGNPASPTPVYRAIDERRLAGWR